MSKEVTKQQADPELGRSINDSEQHSQQQLILNDESQGTFNLNIKKEN